MSAPITPPQTSLARVDKELQINIDDSLATTSAKYTHHSGGVQGSACHVSLLLISI